MRLLMARIVVAGVGAVSSMHIPEGVFWVELAQEDGLFVGLPLCVCVCLHRKLPTGISVKFEILGCLLDFKDLCCLLDAVVWDVSVFCRMGSVPVGHSCSSVSRGWVLMPGWKIRLKVPRLPPGGCAEVPGTPSLPPRPFLQQRAR